MRNIPGSFKGNISVMLYDEFNYARKTKILIGGSVVRVEPEENSDVYWNVLEENYNTQL